MADQLVQAVHLQHGQTRRIHFPQAALGIHHLEAFRFGIDDGAQMILAGAQGLHRELAQCDVLDGAFVIQDRAAAILYRAGIDAHPDRFAVEPAHLRLEVAHLGLAPEHGLPFAITRLTDEQPRVIDAAKTRGITIAQHLHQRRVGIQQAAVTGQAIKTDGHVFEQALEAVFRAEGGLPLLFVRQRDADRGRQAREVLHSLDDIIVQSGLHRLDCGVLVTGAGEHDHRTPGPARFHGMQDRQAVGPADLVIGDTEIEAAAIQRLLQRIGRSDLADLDIFELAMQLTNHQGPVFRIVVHKHDAQRTGR